MNKKKIMPPTYFVACLLLAIILAYAVSSLRVVPGPYRYIGILLIAVGIWLNIWADHLFKHKKTTVKPFETSTALIEKGPFLFTRNPMYLGMIVLLVGAAIAVGSVLSLISPLVFFVIARFHFIPAEEQAMEETFGEKFLDYKSRVRRWL
jgi:protein-S-isoprenylcysteine O-methyltransferase Ste14